MFDTMKAAFEGIPSQYITASSTLTMIMQGIKWKIHFVIVVDSKLNTTAKKWEGESSK